MSKFKRMGRKKVNKITERKRNDQDVEKWAKKFIERYRGAFERLARM